MDAQLATSPTDYVHPISLDPLLTLALIKNLNNEAWDERFLTHRRIATNFNTVRAMGEMREQVLYLTNTTIAIGHLQADELILERTGAIFTLSLSSD